jgi:Holliday junction resolvasome RuvABC ATP-dependent DNA helicase subunit
MSDINEIKKLIPTLFDKIIGQEAAKKKIFFYLNSYLHTGIFPNIIITAPKGQGKTTLAKEIARGLPLLDENGKVVMEPDPKNPEKTRVARKTFVEINCTVVKSVPWFIENVLVKFAGKKVTFFFDEASEIKDEVEKALLSMLNPNPENKNVFVYQDYVCDIDFRDMTFIFATSEPQSVFHALIDRLKRIDLEEYTPSDLAKIVQRGAKEVKFEDVALENVATVLRGNARAAQMMAEEVMAFLRGRTAFNSKDWKNMREQLGIYPLGLNSGEISILRHLRASSEGVSLTALAAKTGFTRQALQRDYEMHLQKHGLMDIQTTGRIITIKGRDYLDMLEGKKPHVESNASINPDKMKATAKVEVK